MPSLDSISQLRPSSTSRSPQAYALMHRKFPCYAFSIEPRPEPVNQVQYWASFKLVVHDRGIQTVIADHMLGCAGEPSSKFFDASMLYKNRRPSHDK
jgi:hypothetical protein